MPLVRDERDGPADGLTGLAPADGEALLRAALEAALAVARAGEEETPAVTAPAALRPLLRFAKLPRRALAATRRALDQDADFRERVAGTTSEDEVGRAGWLYLTRPEGWESELGALAESAGRAARAGAEQQAESEARRRLAATQDALTRAEAAADEARARAAEAATALAGQRRARKAAEERAAAAEAERDALQASARAAESERDAVRASARVVEAECDELRRRVADLEAELRRVAEESAPAPARPSPPAGAPPGAPEEPAAPGAAASAAPFVEEAATAAESLARALRAAAAAMAPEPPAVPGPPGEPAAPPPPQARATSGRSRRARPFARRVPSPLPPAVYDDSVEAAAHLVRVPDAVLVVDGYNVSHAGWPGLAIADQRSRLVDALAELNARTGVDVRVVFDGAEIPVPGPVPSTGRAVKVSFSPPGVEADDVVVELVAALPAHRPVVVASSDRRVRDGAAAAGANVLSSLQLLGLLGR